MPLERLIRMFLGGMFRGAANQTTGAQQRAAEDYLANHPLMRRLAQLSVYNWLRAKELFDKSKQVSMEEVKKRIKDK